MCIQYVVFMLTFLQKKICTFTSYSYSDSVCILGKVIVVSIRLGHTTNMHAIYKIKITLHFNVYFCENHMSI